MVHNDCWLNLSIFALSIYPSSFNTLLPECSARALTLPFPPRVFVLIKTIDRLYNTAQAGVSALLLYAWNCSLKGVVWRVDLLPNGSLSVHRANPLCRGRPIGLMIAAMFGEVPAPSRENPTMASRTYVTP